METLPALQPTEKPSLEAVRSRFETWRRGRNPQTGDSLTLPARRVVTFRCSKVLKDKLKARG